MAQKLITTESSEQTAALCGTGDCNLIQIEKRFSVKIVNAIKTDADTGDALSVSGEDKNVDKAVSAFTYLKRMAAAGDTLSEQSVEYVIGMIEDGNAEELDSYNDNAVICITSKGKPIKPKTVGQRKYTDMIRKNTVVFGIGPAGTGKTFLAVAMAVEALRSKEVSRII